MSKYCSQCGAMLEDTDDICTSCGAPQKKIPASKASKKANAAVGAVIVGVAVIIFRLFLIFYPGDYKEPVENMLKAAETGKGKYLCEACADFMVDTSSEIDSYYADAEEINELLEDEFGDDLSIDYKFKSKKRLKEASIPVRLYGEIAPKSDSMSGYEVKVKVTVKGDDKEKSQTMEFEVLKYKSNWCIINMGDALKELKSII